MAFLTILFLLITFISVSKQYPRRYVDTIVTGTIPQDKLIDIRPVKLTSEGIRSAPGCPKPIGSRQWLYFSEGEVTRCFLAFTQGPCKSNEKFVPRGFDPDTVLGRCFSADDRPASLPHGLAWNSCGPRKIYSKDLGKCVNKFGGSPAVDNVVGSNGGLGGVG